MEDQRMSASWQISSCADSATRFARHLLCLLLVGSVCLTGCGGCSQTPAQKAAAQKKKEQDAEAALEARRKQLEEEKKKKPFIIARLTPLLSENLIATDEGRSLRLAKPGHWTTTVQAMKANLDNFEGRVVSAVLDTKGKPIALPHTPYQMTSSRPAVLAKGRTKRIENELLVPTEAKRLQVRSQLVSRLSGREEALSDELWTLMPSNQYFMLVLAREPARYAFLKVTDAIRAPYEDENGVSPPHYRVVLADASKPLPLPTNVLTWSSVAYIIWDEVNLDRMSAGQQAALVDWLHWGGRLIINGPDSLDTLRNSFLADYLPVDVGERITFDEARLAKLSETWSHRGENKPLKPLAVTRAWSGVELKPREDRGAVALPSAEGLFYECPVGAGSIVASAVQLAERDLINWQGYDGFLNGAILRRPSRKFEDEQEGAWIGLRTMWDDYADRTHDAYFTTPLRWFARDAGTKANSRSAPVDTSLANTQNYNMWGGGYAIPEAEWIVERPGGLGSWSEFTPVSQTAREALADAAGVRVPGASFVVICLAIYLVVLVPLNWMVFHALGKIEWAWISAPIIALAGTLAVVRQAQLDIGFVRSQTEIGLLELQADHPRGHLTRYTAIYSSLSDTYDLEFEDESAVATPFPRDNQWNPAIGDSLATVAFEKYDRPRLRGVAVSSATTQMIHSEQMIELDGAIRMTSPSNNPNLKQLENKSGFNLSDVVVIHRDVSNPLQVRMEGCWVGELRNGAGILLPRTPISVEKNQLPYAAERAKAAALDSRKRLNVDPLLKLAFRFNPKDDPLYGERDEWRLVARIDEVLPGAVASPEASQATGSTVVLAHLKYDAAPFPERDVNSPSDVLQDRPRNAYDEAYEAAYDEFLGEPPPE
jgi:hypothetical protein